MDIAYVNNIPYLKCDSCQHEIKDWLTWEEKYKNFWQAEESWKEKKNHLTVLLGYFCAVYEDYYKVEYTLSLNEKGLFRGPEINVLRRVYSMFNGDAAKVKDYIDFIFTRKVQKRKKRITSLSYLAVQDFVQEYKLMAKRAEQVDRSTVLPKKMLDWVSKFVPDVEKHVELNDFGDLNLLLTHYKEGHFKDVEEVNVFVSKLQKMNYINEQYKINNWRET